jgi:hypothetical protein
VRIQKIIKQEGYRTGTEPGRIQKGIKLAG